MKTFAFVQERRTPLAEMSEQDVRPSQAARTWYVTDCMIEELAHVSENGGVHDEAEKEGCPMVAKSTWMTPVGQEMGKGSQMEGFAAVSSDCVTAHVPPSAICGAHSTATRRRRRARMGRSSSTRGKRSKLGGAFFALSLPSAPPLQSMLSPFTPP
jgi:hypothetical protein